MARYRVLVDDNFHYRGASNRYEVGAFATLEEAITAAQHIVDAFLVKGYRPGKTADALFRDYVGFGEDPFIVADEPHGVLFSAWTYARTRCQELCGQPPATGAAGERSEPAK